MKSKPKHSWKDEYKGKKKNKNRKERAMKNIHNDRNVEKR